MTVYPTMGPDVLNMLNALAIPLYVAMLATKTTSRTLRD